MNIKRICFNLLMSSLILIAAATFPISATAQDTEDEDDIVMLSPFEVTSEEIQGYNAETTLAGNRLNTKLRDVGSAISVVTIEFIRDIGAEDNASLLQYTPGTEVGGTRGNFAGVGDAASLNEDTLRPNQNTRIRGLAEADNTREFFRTDIPWDAYNVERVDLQRGPNSILFGQGSPSGIINTGLKSAQFSDFGSVELKIGSFGTYRGSLDYNTVILDNELAVRVDLLHDNEKFQQDSSYSRDKRFFGAVRYEPEALNKNGIRTIIKVNYEIGEVDSNNPRVLPPADSITPWFTELNQATYNQFQAFDHLSDRPNHGQFRVNLASTGAPNPAYEPYIGTFGFPSPRSGPAVFFSGSDQRMYATDIIGPFVSGGVGSDGNIDGGIAAMPDNGWVSIQGTGQWAINAGADYSKAGLWKNNLITNPGIFDFYNKLIDGNTKREWQDFSVTNISISQTYLDNRLGISLDFNREQYENGQKAMLPGEVRLQIDPMAVYGDGTPDAGATGGEPYANGTPNPNVGRAFVSSNNAWSNRSFDADRKTVRATVFYTHDFTSMRDNWFTRFLGVHTLTGLLGKEEFNADSREWQRYGIFDSAAYDLYDRASERFNQTLTPVQIVYLGDSLLGQSVSDAGIPAISGKPEITSGQLNYFDSTWNGTVDPADPWENGFYLPGSATAAATQAENPANYVGWSTVPVSIIDAEDSAANRDRLTTRASLDKAVTKSQVFVWQGKWLTDSIVTTFGWRKDIARSWAFDMSPNDFDAANDRGAVDLSSDYYTLPSTSARAEVQSRSWSLVSHLMDLPFLSKKTADLPFEVSLYYNRSTNFKPDASRVDIYGEQHPAPSGKTIDRGIRIATRDGRYSLRVNRFKTTNSSASSTQINAVAIGNWMQLTQNFTNVFGYDIRPWGYDATDPSQVAGESDIFDGATGIWEPMRYNFHYFLDNRTWSDSAVVNDVDGWVVDPELENSIIAAVRSFQRAVDPRFWAAWRIDTFGDFGPSTHEVTYTVPTGFAIIEDNISKGWEIELSAEPTKNWRLSLNASKTDAVRTNVGNANIREFMDLVAASLRIGEPDGVGALHHYWGTEDVVTAGKNWFDGEGLVGAPGSEWRLAQLVEDTTVAELREWRVNLITNYSFTSGALEGINFGGAMRYQSSPIIAYPPTGDPNDPTTVEYNLSQPVKGESETNFDLWAGYSKKLNEKINWRIQLNVYNAFSGGNDLIPITAQPTGEFAAYRIAPRRTWSITSIFEF